MSQAGSREQQYGRWRRRPIRHRVAPRSALRSGTGSRARTARPLSCCTRSASSSGRRRVPDRPLTHHRAGLLQDRRQGTRRPCFPRPPAEDLPAPGRSTRGLDGKFELVRAARYVGEIGDGVRPPRRQLRDRCHQIDVRQRLAGIRGTVCLASAAGRDGDASPRRRRHSDRAARGDRRRDGYPPRRLTSRRRDSTDGYQTDSRPTTRVSHSMSVTSGVPHPDPQLSVATGQLTTERSHATVIGDVWSKTAPWAAFELHSSRLPDERRPRHLGAAVGRALAHAADLLGNAASVPDRTENVTIDPSESRGVASPVCLVITARGYVISCRTNLVSMRSSLRGAQLPSTLRSASARRAAPVPGPGDCRALVRFGAGS